MSARSRWWCPSSSIAAAHLAGLAAFAAGCDVVAPPEAPPPAPDPAWVVSTPFSDVRSLNDVLVLSPALAYAVGTDGTILKMTATEEEVTWSREESGVTVDLEGITGFVDGDGVEHIFVVGHEGTVLQRAGEAWALIPSGTTRVLFSVAMRRVDDVFIAGDAGTVLRWNGTVMSVQDQQTRQLVVGADGSQNFFPIPEPLKGIGDGGDVMLAVGARGAVYTYDPNGEPAGASNRWSREDSGTTRALAGIFTEAGVWVPTTDGVLMRRNGPGDWDDDSIRTPAPVFLQDVYVGDGVFAVGLSEDIYHLDGSGTWNLTRLAEGAELRAVDGTRIEPPPEEDGEEDVPGQLVIAVGGGGRIARGPLFLPVNGEALLGTRVSEDDFVE